MKQQSGLIIFIKNTEKGKVKTRLAATVGDDRALEIYKALLQHTRQLACSVDADRFLFYSNYIEKEDDWSTDDFNKKVQTGVDLGTRITNAFQEVFKENNKVVIIGSDCASLTSAILEAAFEKLEEFPFVIGPATDGGYYLLGMNRMEPSVFEKINWSTAEVFPATIARVEALGKRYFILPELSDIDYEEDWVKFGWKI